MNQAILLTLLVAVTLNQAYAKQWAVLVAGSEGYDNYRHQSDVCHAYQVLRAHGIPESQIVVMMEDDIAYNSQNPYKGTLINKPGGKNVYQGVPKDYTGSAVTPQNFFKVLAGDRGLKSQGKKVVESGPSDTVFVFYSDHGSPGMLSMPHGVLYARDLISNLKSLSQNQKFARMVLYIEACHSGSMFENLLPGNINIYATTAANARESSYACYWDGGRRAYLGDLYSVSWMEDSDSRANLNGYALRSQFRKVKQLVHNSEVQEWGSMQVGQRSVGEFQGAGTARVNRNQAVPYLETHPENDAVPADDVPLIVAQKLAEITGYADDGQESSDQKHLHEIVEGRKYMDTAITLLTEDLAKALDLDPQELKDARLPLTRAGCAKKLQQTFNEHCFDIAKHTYAMKHMWPLTNACELMEEDEVKSAAKVIKGHCQRRQTPMTTFDRIV